MQIAVIVVQILLALAFLMAGMAKLIGVKWSLANRDRLGVVPWFWRLTGIIEVASALLLVTGIWVHALALVGGALLAATMIGAFSTNVLHRSPAAEIISNIVLFALAVFVVVLLLPGIGSI